MSAKGPRGRLEFLTRESSVAEWRLLGALAVERELGGATLQRLAAVFGISVIPRTVARSVSGLSASGGGGPARGAAGPALLPALERWRDSGLLVELSRARTATNEAAFSVHPEFRQLVLRRLAARGDLQAVVEACHVALGERSLGVLVLLLQTGRLGEFQRYAYNVPRAATRLGEEIDADDLLREAILMPFDAAWFEAVWGEFATAAGLRVARDALPRLHECDPLFAWLLERLGHTPAPASAPEEESPNLQIARETLAEHAFLRDRPELVESLADTLPRAERLGFRAAAA